MRLGLRLITADSRLENWRLETANWKLGTAGWVIFLKFLPILKEKLYFYGNHKIFTKK